jgi:hypothetical protein
VKAAGQMALPSTRQMKFIFFLKAILASTDFIVHQHGEGCDELLDLLVLLF